jgi:hypothetical protein
MGVLQNALPGQRQAGIAFIGTPFVCHSYVQETQ